MKLAPATWVVLCNGQKYLILENTGDETTIRLKPVARDTRISNAPLVGDWHRSKRISVFSRRKWRAETGNVHDLDGYRFVVGLARKLDGWIEQGRTKTLVIIADQMTLSQLRDRLSEHSVDSIVAEFGNEFIPHSTTDIVSFLEAA